MPGELADNQLLFDRLSAVVTVENTTPVSLYFHHRDNEPSSIDPQGVFLRDVELFDAAERKLSLTSEQEKWLVSISSGFASGVPTAERLASRKKPCLYELPPGKSVELPVNILGEWSRIDFGLKPGTYTARVTVSFSQAPSAGALSGETRRIVCEPVTVTVTEEHIKQAKAYWKIPE